MNYIHGCITALITPFDKKGNLDKITFKKLIRRQIESGIHGLVPCGTTGESPTLSHKEHDKVIEITVREANGRVPVIAGTGSNSTLEAIRLTKAAEKAGANASLQVVPYYNKPTQRGLFNHFSQIALKTKLPIILYNIPGRSVVDLDIKTIIELVKKNRNIIGIKEASGSIKKVKDIIKNCPKKFIVLSGEDSLNFSILKQGGKGFISVTSNLLPKECSDIYNNFISGEIKKSEKINNKLKRINEFLFLETNPIPIKFAMNHLKLCSNEIRSPLVKLSKKFSDKLVKEITKLKK